MRQARHRVASPANAHECLIDGVRLGCPEGMLGSRRNPAIGTQAIARTVLRKERVNDV